MRLVSTFLHGSSVLKSFFNPHLPLVNFCIFSFVLPLPTQLFHFFPKTYFGSLHSSVNLYLSFPMYHLLNIFQSLASYLLSVKVFSCKSFRRMDSDYRLFNLSSFEDKSFQVYHIPNPRLLSVNEPYQNQDLIWSSLQNRSKDYKGLHRIESRRFSGEAFHQHFGPVLLRCFLLPVLKTTKTDNPWESLLPVDNINTTTI